jgi:hypothetical protein
MNDKQVRNFAIIAALIGAAWWILRPGTAQPAADAGGSAGPVAPWMQPYQGVNVAGLAPASPPALNVNVANQFAGLLSHQYVPLFGFVGMAQGSMWQ